MCVCFTLNGFCSFSVRKWDVAVQLEKQKGTVMRWWAKKKEEWLEKLARKDPFNRRVLVSQGEEMKVRERDGWIENEKNWDRNEKCTYMNVFIYIYI